MSEYISIRDELYKKLDSMRIENDGKKTSFSDSIDTLFKTIEEKDKVIEEKDRTIRKYQIDM
jgi:predicted CopG family antitoxin